MEFKQYKRKYVDVDEMNKILKKIKKVTVLLYEGYKLSSKYSLATHSFIEDKMVNFSVTTKWYEQKPCTYILDKTKGEIKHIASPLDCYKTLRRYYKQHDVLTDVELGKDFYKGNDGKIKPSAAPLIGYSEEHNHKEEYIYEYDLNSAYSSALYDYIPDTTKHRRYGFVKKGEVGFFLDDKLTMVDEGGFADIIFPLMDSPYKEFINIWYGKKKNAKTKEDKQKAKEMLNISIGYLQRKNPYIRAYVINTCNKRIMKLIDEHTAMWNTDAIYSTVERPDLKIGDGLGEWKLEYQGLIKLNKNNYQLVEKDNITHYRGTPSDWFGKEFNLLEDAIPKVGNIYKYNKEKNKICFSLKED